VLDVESGFLRQRGEEIPLQPKAFAVLRYMVERHLRLVIKSEFGQVRVIIDAEAVRG
jgi:DNA-binding winged helix-turn-helix (wHTH) protein